MIKKCLLALATGTCLMIAMPSANAAKTAGDMVDDTTLATAAKTALIDSDKVSANDINVEVYQGHVQLAGFVDSEAERAAALAAAGKVEGVTKVEDGMVVLAGSRSMGVALDDTNIQAKLKTKLVTQEGVEKGFDINTDVKQGHVLLSGWVNAEKYKKQAGDVAAAIDGVKKVHNMILVKP